ncbi:helix-turn-helix domain-containing protein [Streptomyces sp. SID5785]|uniref:helix-turn-helix domain-containing protein n=1 Tax=Streptomyces sp. SID5785 TaxID=2690309 RepID=UPI001361E152|nr:helix-turn-helix domain-containing protein [Streptomyces sp. SID5785]MZD05794.1 helix-turn-helix domain-containing protein [Streptomyces sp. SID5785]
MLRIHFTHADLARTRIATAPDPLWEIASSLHRLQSRRGRWAYAGWYRTARTQLRENGLERALRDVLLPLYPRAAYFPDFLTPPDAIGDLRAGLDSILAAPPGRVQKELSLLGRATATPPWTGHLVRGDVRQEFVAVLRAYHAAVIAPYEERAQARIEAERARRCRSLLDGGVEGMLAGLGPMLRWRSPVLEVAYPKQVEDRDLYLNGRGLTLVPSYFNWGEPVAFADPRLPPVLWYSLLHEPSRPSEPQPEHESLVALLGRARAVALRVAATGATTGELARAAGVSASSASRHATVLRDAGLLTTVRTGPSVLHTLTPAGAALLRASTE